MWNIFTRDSSKDFSFEVTECPNYKFNEKSLWKLNKGKRKVKNYNYFFKNVPFILIKTYKCIIFFNFFMILFNLYHDSSLIDNQSKYFFMSMEFFIYH